MSLSKERRIAITLHAVEKLIDIEILKLRKINGLSSYKERIINALKDIYLFFDLDDTSAILEVYSFKEEELRNKEDFYKKMNMKEDHVSNNRVEFVVSIYNELVEYAGSTVYGICQTQKSKHFELYDLEHKFWDIVSDFSDEKDLPTALISRLYSHFSTEKLEYDRKIYDISNLSSTDWFQKKKDEFSNYSWSELNSKKTLYDHLEHLEKNTEEEDEKPKIKNDFIAQRMAKYKKERDNVEHRTASLYLDLYNSTVQILAAYSSFDSDTHSFSALNYVGYSKLIEARIYDQEDKDLLIDSEFSNSLSNKDIETILILFPELGLTGFMIEGEDKFTRVGSGNTFKDRDGNITHENMTHGKWSLQKLTITLSSKAKWDSNHNNGLERLLKCLNAEKNLVFIDEKPVISL